MHSYAISEKNDLRYMNRKFGVVNQFILCILAAKELLK